MKVLNTPVDFDYKLTCNCEAVLVPSFDDLECYDVKAMLNQDYIYLCECPVCNSACEVPAGVIPPAMRDVLKSKATKSQSPKKLMCKEN